MASVLKYSSELGSMTSDRGIFTMEFSHYEEVPLQLVDKLIQQLKAQQEEAT